MSKEPDLEFQKQISDLIDEVEPLLEKLRASGINTLLLSHTYDPLSDETYSQWREFGDRTALRGVIEDYIACSEEKTKWLFNQGDDDQP